MVYMLTHGDYSDYRVDYVTLSQEVATKTAELFGYTVEIVELLEAPPAHKMVLQIKAIVNEEGEETEFEEKGWAVREEEAGRMKCNHWRNVRAVTNDNEDGSRSIVSHFIEVSVQGTNHKRVRKVLSEQVAQAKAEYYAIVGEWVTKYPIYGKQTWRPSSLAPRFSMTQSPETVRVLGRGQGVEDVQTEQLQISGAAEMLAKWKMPEETEGPET